RPGVRLPEAAPGHDGRRPVGMTARNHPPPGGLSMAHDHSHDDPKTYYVEQLCMIGVAGALGGIAVMLYLRESLWFLIPPFQKMVLAGGVGLLVVVAVRAVVVWVQAGRARAQEHDHAHDHAHEHGHDHCHGGDCDHDHDHDHDHGHG